MATTAVLFTLLTMAAVPRTMPASLPETTTRAPPSSRAALDTAVKSQELDLADLSLPPEVITEALFSQVDIVQDLVEQCEEEVRNNLRGDSSAETGGIDFDDDSDENDEEDVTSDDIIEEIAQLAINKAMSAHSSDDHTNTDGMAYNHTEDDNDLTSTASDDGGESDDGDDDENLDDDTDDVDEEDEEEEDEDEEEEDEDGNEYTDEQEEDTHGISESESIGEEHSRSLTSPNREDADRRDTTVSDAEETDTEPDSMEIPIIRDHTKPSETAGDDESEDTTGALPQQKDREMYPTHFDTDTDEASSHTVKSADEDNTPDLTAPAASSHRTRTDPRGAQGPLSSSDPQDDSSRTETRRKRSVSAHYGQLNVVEGGARESELGKFRVSLGHGRIRRHAIRSSLVAQKSMAVEEIPSPVEEGQITSTETEIEEYINRVEEEELHHDRQLDLLNTKLEEMGRPDATKETDAQDVARATSTSFEERLRRLDNVLKTAETFIQADSSLHSPKGTHSSRSERTSTRFMPTFSNPSRRRFRRAVTERLNPERYVPLIGQLVERLKYLRHSLDVCHRLLPPGHALKTK